MALLFVVVPLGTLQVGCAAVYPELSTSLSTAPALPSYEPPPPPGRVYFRVNGAKIPYLTRDGRKWDQTLSNLPDPMVKVFLNDAEILRSDIESDTLEPTWKTAPKGNFEMTSGDRLRFEIWDANALSNDPIGIKEIRLSPEVIDGNTQELNFENDVRFTFTISPAKPLWGVGLWYELRTGASYITRLIDGSPASRAGIRRGDKVLSLQGRPVDTMDSAEVRGLFTAIPVSGLRIAVQHEDGTTLQTVVKLGPIYPLFSEYGDPDKPL